MRLPISEEMMAFPIPKAIPSRIVSLEVKVTFAAVATVACANAADCITASLASAATLSTSITENWASAKGTVLRLA